MSSGPIATASVKIVPDLTGFKTLLRTEVNASIRSIKLTPLKVPVIAAPHRTALRNEVNASVRSLRITPIRVPVVTTPVGGAGAGAAAAGAAAGGAGGGRAAARATKEIEGVSKASNALRGSLIGLSHVTPVTVFGLGLYGTAALAAGLAIKGIISTTADFEHQLNVLQATTGATAAEMVSISEEAKKLGADLSLPATSAGDAAKAMTELAKAGLSIQDTLKGARGVLQLAAAAQIDVGTAAQFVATELNAFELAGTQAVHVADLLSGASIAAQGDIRDFGTAFQQVSAVAHGANVSLETTTGLLTELARAGLRGADAGTSIRTFLLRLTPTTKQAAQYQEALNIRLDQTRTIGEQLPQLINQYRAALSALTPIQQQQALTQIFGQDAIRAATILTRGGSDALRENTDAANQNGAAARLAAANAKGLSGAFAGLKSNTDTLSITLGSFVKGPLTDLVTLLSESIGLANRLADSLDKIKPPKGLTGSGAGRAALLTALGPFAQLTGLEVAAAKRLQARGQKNPYEIAAEEVKKQREANNKAADKLAAEVARSVHDEGTNAQKIANASKRSAVAVHDESARFSTEPNLTNKEKAAIRARIKALQDAKDRKALEADITAPIGLQVAQLNAQLNDSLQQELTADQAIEAYFHRRLGTAKEGTKRYEQILGSLTQAHAATQSVLGQINSESEQAQQEREQAIQDAVSLQRTRLENAAELTDHQGEAERKLIAFYLAESRDLRLEAAARLSYEAAYNSERKAQQAAIVAQVKAEIDLRNSRLDLAIQRAGLTPGVGDDRRAINAKIKRLQQDIDNINKIKKKTLEQKQAIVDLQSAILSLQQQAKDLNGAQSGFSLQDLFKAAADQFNTFGSNISARNGVLSGQDERARFGKTVLNNRDRGVSLQGQQLTQQQQTNRWLEQILAKMNSQGVRIGGPKSEGKGKKGNLISIYGTEIAAAYNYGVN